MQRLSLVTHCPVGTLDNSPPIYRWVWAAICIKNSNIESARIGLTLHNAVAIFLILIAIAHCAVDPGFLPMGFLIMVPPTIAAMSLAFGHGRLSAAFLTGCQVYLGILSAAVVLAELSLWIANLPLPNNLGIPPRQSRIVLFFLIADGFFLYVLLLGNLFGRAIHHDLVGKHKKETRARLFLYGIASTWLLTLVWMATLLVLAVLN